MNLQQTLKSIVMRKLFSTLLIALSLVAVPIFTPSCAKENKEESEKVEVNFPLSRKTP